MKIQDVVDAVIVAVKNYFAIYPPDDYVYATFNAANGTDPALSNITLINGTPLTGVPKYAHVTGLVSGDVIECVHRGNNKPLTIVGRLSGNPTLL